MQGVQRQGNQGISLSIFKSGKNQRISPFLDKIRDTSDDFIMDKGRNQGYMIFCLISLKMNLNYK